MQRRKHKMIKGIISLMLVMQILFARTASAASVYTGYHLASTATVVRTVGTLDMTYSSAIAQGIRRWNDTDLFSITYGADTDNTITTTSSSESWYGITDITYKGTVVTKYAITINKTKISSAASSSTYVLSIGISVVSHEFGHVFGLADITDTTNTTISIMNSARDRTTLLGPTTRDVNLLKAIY